MSMGHMINAIIYNYELIIGPEQTNNRCECLELLTFSIVTKINDTTINNAKKSYNSRNDFAKLHAKTPAD